MAAVNQFFQLMSKGDRVIAMLKALGLNIDYESGRGVAKIIDTIISTDDEITFYKAIEQLKNEKEVWGNVNKIAK